MLDVIWVVVLDSQSSVSVTNVLRPEEGSSAVHLSLDLELSSVSFWVSWEFHDHSVVGPLGRSVLRALVPHNWSVVRVVSALSGKTLAGWVDPLVSASSSLEVDLLV